MPAFTMKWDDFGGGFYVGQNESKQPRSTFTGYNVNVAAHDGAAVPANQVWQRNLALGSESVGITVANNSVHITDTDPITITDTLMSNEISYTLLFKTDTSGGYYVKAIAITGVPQVVSTLNLATQTNNRARSQAWLSVSDYPSNLTYGYSRAYFCAGGTLYRITSNGTISTHATMAANTGDGGKMAIYGSRMVQARDNTLVFSDAGDYTSWPTLNYITVGDGALTEALIPRYDDLVWVRSDGVYLVYGTLGFNAAVRKISDSLDTGNLYTDQYISDRPITGKDNAVYYMDESLLPFYSNIKMLYGNQVRTVAYQKTDRIVDSNVARSRPSLTATNSGCLVSMWPQLGTGQAGFEALIRKRDNTFVKLKQAPLTFNPGTLATTDYILWWSADKDLGSQYLGFYDNVFITQYAQNSAGTKVTLSYGIWQPEQINAGYLPGPPSGAGSTSTTNTATPGLLELSPIETEVPSKVRRVYVEADLDLDFYTYDDFRGTAYIEAFVENRAVDDVSFTNNVNFVSSQMLTSIDLTTVNNLTSQAINGSWSPSTPYTATNDKKRAIMTRILRFDPNDSGYGYKHYVSFEFQGFRIRRVWVEGDTR